MHLHGLSEKQTQWEICKSFFQREHCKISLQDYVSLVSRLSAAWGSANYLQAAEVFAFCVTLADHGYWRRAWVTQETMLA